jgi:hypothetical protein
VRPLLHLLSIILVLPGFLLAVAFTVLGRAIATQSLLGVLAQLLADAVSLIPWGLLAGCVLVLLIAIGGMFVQTRWLAGSCVAVLGIGSTAVLCFVVLPQSNFTLDQLPFLLLGVFASVIGLWFVLTERPRGESTPAA